MDMEKTTLTRPYTDADLCDGPATVYVVDRSGRAVEFSGNVSRGQSGDVWVHGTGPRNDLYVRMPLARSNARVVEWPPASKGDA